MPPAPPPLRGLFHTDLRTRALYSEGAGIYRILPQAVAAPADEADLIRLIRWSLDQKTSLIPRGAGSAVTGSNVGDGVILDLTRMQPRVLEISPATRTARTSANVRWGELQAEAARHGLRLPPDPSSGRFATLGGMVSTNASGARTVRYGSMRPWVQALSCITIGGERARLERGVPGPLPVPEAVLREKADLIRARFPRTSKNSAGYALDAWLDSGDTLDLLIGAEGTLAIITEIEWRLDPVPAYRAGLRVDLDSLDRLTEAVEGLLPLQPSALELLDRTFLDLVRTTRDVDVAPGATESVLLLEFEGDNQQSLRGTVGDAIRTLKSSALNIETALVPQDEEKIWNLRHAASPIIADLPPGRRSLQVIEDACVPIPRMGEYIASVRTLAARLHVPVVIFGHAGDGNIHVNLLPDTRTAGWEQSVELIHQDITTEVIRLGGTTSGEHGDGRIRGAQLEQLYGAEIMELFRLLKDTFDPAGILNPGVKLPVKGGLPGALRDLKVGDLAAGIPDDIAETLREIERNGDYLRDRLYLS